jgi:hypothetical protein
VDVLIFGARFGERMHGGSEMATGAY